MKGYLIQKFSNFHKIHRTTSAIESLLNKKTPLQLYFCEFSEVLKKTFLQITFGTAFEVTQVSISFLFASHKVVIILRNVVYFISKYVFLALCQCIIRIFILISLEHFPTTYLKLRFIKIQWILKTLLKSSLLSIH